jgi:23S rRNA (cytosine1962-C5)-methyltransferase
LKKEPINETLLRFRIIDAISLRLRLFHDENVYRLVYSEADYLPGLIVDRFGDILVLQVLTAGIHRFLNIICDILVEQVAPKGILVRFDTTYREQESLPSDPIIPFGTVPPTLTMAQDELSWAVDPWNGHKTGFYLDQRPARRLVMSLATGQKALDLFCYSGAFSVYAIKGGAITALGVDSSADALKSAEQNAAINGFADRCHWLQTDVFDFVKSEPQELFDLVIIDPPSLVKNRRKKMSGMRAYRDLNARAMQWIKPGGRLLTSSCSGLVNQLEFFETLGEAAVKAGRQVRLIERLTQGLDHPIRPEIPETEYLKVCLLEVN